MTQDATISGGLLHQLQSRWLENHITEKAAQDLLRGGALEVLAMAANHAVGRH